MNLRLDEKVWQLIETVRDKPRFGPHRYQIIWSRRGEQLVKFEKDLGPELLYPGASLFQFFCGNEYSVGEAMEIADRAREGKPPEEREPTDLLGEYKKELEEKEALRAHRSVSGPLLTVQRR